MTWSFAASSAQMLPSSDEVRAARALDRLDDLGIGGVDELADLAADRLLPLGQRVDVGVDTRVGGVGHDAPP